MDEKMNLRDIADGKKFQSVECVMTSFYHNRNRNRYEVTLQSGDCVKRGSVGDALFSYTQMQEMKDKVIVISGVHEPGLGTTIAESLKIKRMEIPESTEENLLANYIYIAAEEIAFYIKAIKSFVASVTEGSSYRKLLEVYFTESNLQKMRTMPATHVRQSSPMGGMLQATVTVTDMAYYLAHRYLNYGNNVYSFREKGAIDWDLLVTGGLMHLAGNFLYFEKEVPHHKTVNGVEQGFSACRQQYIMHLLLEHPEIAMTQDEISALFGVISRLNEQQDGIKKCRQEAMFLYQSYCCFLEADTFDEEATAFTTELLSEQGAANNEEDDAISYRFSEHLNCYISASELERRSLFLKARNEKKGNVVAQAT